MHGDARPESGTVEGDTRPATAPTLDDAILLAVEAHRGQVDKAGQPYILHPLRVMLRLDREPDRTVAILHDVVEDTGYTLDDLRFRGYPAVVLQALDCLTRRPNESYAEFVARVSSDPLARRVKLADLEDNLDVRRLPQVEPSDAARLGRYMAAWRHLRDADGR